MQNNKHFQSILKRINSLTYAHDTWAIFYDFLEMAAICISNTLDTMHYDAREEQYLKVIKKYNPEHQKMFAEMFAEFVLALELEYQRGNFFDILGCLFHELGLHNKFKGQFFTPQHICTMMGKMLLDENDKTILEHGFIRVAEPTCGSGAMVLGFAQAMRDCGYNHSQQMLVLATDIDLKCVYMCYLQLSLYGIPAVIIHGNSLTGEEWSRWYTPVYFIGGWAWRKRTTPEIPKDMPHDETPIASETKIKIPAAQETAKPYAQLDLFSIFDERGED